MRAQRGRSRRAYSSSCRPRRSRQSDADFLAARAAYDRGDWARLDALAPPLAAHPLARYVEFWQIDSRIDSASAQAVHDFLARYPDGPLADRLRSDWLKSLGKRGDWTDFAVDYPPPSGQDTELQCYGIQYRWQRDGAAALRGGKTAVVHRQDDARCLPAAVRGADRRAGTSPSPTGASASGLQRRRATFGLPMRSPTTCRATGGSPRASSPKSIAIRCALSQKGKFSLKTPASRELALYALDRAALKERRPRHVKAG